MAQLSIKYKDEATPFLKVMDRRMSPESLRYMNINIIGRVIHAEVTYNFQVQGRSQGWEALKPIYAKVKASNTTRFLMKMHPPELGVYPTPWGNIGVKSGLLFASLGSIFRVTARMVMYGTTVPYASQFEQGHQETGMLVQYTNKNGKFVSYYKSFNVWVPGRPFMYVSEQAENAIQRALLDYITADKDRIQITIPNIGHAILALGGRNVKLLK